MGLPSLWIARIAGCVLLAPATLTCAAHEPDDSDADFLLADSIADTTPITPELAPLIAAETERLLAQLDNAFASLPPSLVRPAAVPPEENLWEALLAAAQQIAEIEFPDGLTGDGFRAEGIPETPFESCYEIHDGDLERFGPLLDLPPFTLEAVEYRLGLTTFQDPCRGTDLFWNDEYPLILGALRWQARIISLHAQRLAQQDRVDDAVDLLLLAVRQPRACTDSFTDAIEPLVYRQSEAAAFYGLHWLLDQPQYAAEIDRAALAQAFDELAATPTPSIAGWYAHDLHTTVYDGLHNAAAKFAHIAIAEPLVLGRFRDRAAKQGSSFQFAPGFINALAEASRQPGATHADFNRTMYTFIEIADLNARHHLGTLSETESARRDALQAEIDGFDPDMGLDQADINRIAFGNDTERQRMLAHLYLDNHYGRRLLAALSPWFEAGLRSAERAFHVQLALLRTRIAIERYEQAHTQLPSALNDLVAANLLDTVPVDPYQADGGPIHYDPARRLIWSEGDRNGDQSGGEGDIARTIPPPPPTPEH